MLPDVADKSLLAATPSPRATEAAKSARLYRLAPVSGRKDV